MSKESVVDAIMAAAIGFAVSLGEVTMELAGSQERDKLQALERRVAEKRQALRALIERHVPEDGAPR